MTHPDDLVMSSNVMNENHTVISDPDDVSLSSRTECDEADEDWLT